MCPQRVSVGPVLDKHKPQRIFTIAVNRMRQAPRFLPGAAHVGNAEREDVVNAVRPSLDTARDNKHGPNHNTRTEPAAYGIAQISTLARWRPGYRHSRRSAKAQRTIPHEWTCSSAETRKGPMIHP